MAGLDFLGQQIWSKALQQNEMWHEESSPYETMNVTANKPHQLGSLGICPPAVRLQPYYNAADSGDISSLSPHVAAAITDSLHDLISSVNPAPVDGSVDMKIDGNSALAALSAVLNRRALASQVGQPAASPFAGNALLKLREETGLAAASAGQAAVLSMQPLLDGQSYTATSSRTFLDASLQQLGLCQQNFQQGKTLDMAVDQMEQWRNLVLLQQLDTWAAAVEAAQQQAAASGQAGGAKGQQQQGLQRQLTTKDSAAAGRVVEEDDDESMDLDLEHQPEGKGKGRRGRPPKVPGQFSKGYLAIKRYRQRKKSMVEAMEEELAAKQSELEALTAENRQLMERLRSMDSYLCLQEELMTSINTMKQTSHHGTPPTAASHSPSASAAAERGGSGAASAAGAALQAGRSLSGSNIEAAPAGGSARGSPGVGVGRPTSLVEPASSNSSASSSASGAAALPANCNNLTCSASSAQPQLAGGLGDLQHPAGEAAALSALQQGAEAADFAALSARYKSFVQQCAARVVGIAQLTASANGGSGWPVSPFSLEESLALWKMNSPMTSSAAGLTHDRRADGDVVLNFDSGLYEPVPPGLWVTVAQQVGLQEGQKEQLMESWQLFAAGLQKLNVDRQLLRGRLNLYDQQLRRGTSGSLGMYAAHHLSLCGDLTGLGEVTALVDELDGSLARGRMLDTVCGWSMQSCFDAEQYAKLCVTCWPRLPLMPAVVGCLLAAGGCQPVA